MKENQDQGKFSFYLFKFCDINLFLIYKGKISKKEGEEGGERAERAEGGDRAEGGERAKGGEREEGEKRI